MRNVHLYGQLQEISSKPLALEVATAAEAIRAIGTQIPRFLELLHEGSYEVIRGNRDETGMWLDLDEVAGFNLGQADLHIVPVIEGAKGSGGIIKTVLGVALIGAAVFFSGGTLAAPIAGGSMLGLTYGNMAFMGLVLALSGVSQLLSKPSNDKKDKKTDSFMLSGPSNSYDQGSPVPLIYGEVITGGVLISGGIDIENIGAFTG
jgi:predicted phage tail protein